ncbi:MAG: rRNA adenine N(6)-methyltransferase family protein, partial [Oscillospiraceae bacterium]|nr:rRNA adenine N(6)-methyltransferase family protein [Oscillospiraceae bacterium]
MAFVARAGRAEESPRTSAEVSARALTQTSLQDSLRVSQNFLTSPALIRRIVRLAHFTPGDTIVEVGAGKGHLTRGLLETGAAVTAVELDGALYRGLKEKFGAQKNLRLVHADFLDWPLPRTSYKVFANIPFNRTTAIVRKLTGEAGADGSAREGQHRHTNSPRANVQAGARTSPRAGNRLPEEAWLIMEKGAAKRFLGQPRESLFSMLLKPFFDLDICYHFRREDFHPAPAVDTVLLQLK